MNMQFAKDNIAAGLSRAAGRYALYLAPPVVAGIAVWNEVRLTELSRTHEATLPLAIMLLMSALLQPRLRQYLVVTLCYGVAFLAIRDTDRVLQMPLPAALNYDWADALRPISLRAVAVLAAIAGVAESVKPGTVWARRCYFGASALYFTGLGVMNYASSHSWRGMALIVTGLTAFVGCILAHLVVAAEVVSDDELPNDELAQQAREAAHRAALQTKEWRGNIIAIIEDCDGAMPGVTRDVPRPL
jgi:hypothetical protein